MNTSGVEDFSASRLTLARERRGLTKQALAARLKLTSRAVSGYESGEIVPSHDSLDEIARVLGFPRSFFCLEEVDPLARDSVSFRAQSRASMKLQRRVLAVGTLALEFSALISARFELPEVKVPDLHDMGPIGAAQALRVEWGLGERPIRNMVHLLESKGVRVFSLSEDCQSIDAFSFWRDSVPYVFLNNQKTAEHAVFDAAHELGHLVLHPQGAAESGAEREADEFASNLLLPKTAMLSEAPRLVSIRTLCGLKARWRTSVAAIAYRLHGLGLMSDWHYRQINIELSKRGRANEPMPQARETSAVLKKVFAALDAKGVSLRDLARELRIPASELREVTFGPVSIDGGGERVRRGPP
ncbi:MAG: XRE family transcriptional regulator [Polyangiaceae bacterium]